MKSDLNKFKDSTNIALQEIHVTSELKQKTIEKCTTRTINWRALAYIPAVAILSLLIFTSPFVSFFQTSKNNTANIPQQMREALLIPNNKVQKTEEIQNSSSIVTPEAAQAIDIITPSIALDTNKSKAIVNPSTAKEPAIPSSGIKPDEKQVALNIPQPPVSSTEKQENPKTKIASSAKSSVSPASNNDSTQAMKSTILQQPVVTMASNNEDDENLLKAEKYLNTKNILPTYIPEGYKLNTILVPDEETSSKAVKIEYSNNELYFTVSEDKTSSSTELEDSKEIKINDITGLIKTTSSNEEGKEASPYTILTWKYKEISYSIEGTAAPSVILDIATSIK